MSLHGTDIAEGAGNTLILTKAVSPWYKDHGIGLNLTWGLNSVPSCFVAWISLNSLSPKMNKIALATLGGLGGLHGMLVISSCPSSTNSTNPSFRLFFNWIFLWKAPSLLLKSGFYSTRASKGECKRWWYEIWENITVSLGLNSPLVLWESKIWTISRDLSKRRWTNVRYNHWKISFCFLYKPHFQD